MTFDDTFAYIPLFAIATVAIILLILLVVSKKKSSARISYTTIASLLIVIFTNFSTAFSLLLGNESKSAISTYAITMFFAAFLQLPYCIMLCTFEPRKFDKLVPKSANLAAQKVNEQLKVAEEKAVELSTHDLTLLDVSRDFMVHAAEAYSSDKGMSSFLEYINKTIKDHINADGAAILMIDDFEDVISVKAFEGDFPPPYKLPSDMPHKPVRVATNFKFASFPLKDNIFGSIATTGRPELITKPELDDRIYQNGPEDFLECGSYIIVPMKIQDTVIGITAFARKRGTEVFTEDDLKAATTLSDFAAASIKNVISVKDIIEHSEITKEAEISAKIQNMLIPAKLPIISGTQIASLFEQSEGVCGDYYDILVSRKDRVSFIMSDIAGKGINSILVMTMVRAMLRLVINTTQSAGKILSWVNRGIAAESFSTDHFGSVALINYNPIEQTLEFATSGIIPVYYYDAEEKNFTCLSEPSEPIGVEKTTEYKDYVKKVKKGDIIITYTDGLVESLNEKGQQYTKESLLRIISENVNKPSKDIIRTIKADIKNFSGSVSQHDDKSLLVIKIQ